MLLLYLCYYLFLLLFYFCYLFIRLSACFVCFAFVIIFLGFSILSYLSLSVGYHYLMQDERMPPARPILGQYDAKVRFDENICK